MAGPGRASRWRRVQPRGARAVRKPRLRSRRVGVARRTGTLRGLHPRAAGCTLARWRSRLVARSPAAQCGQGNLTSGCSCASRRAVSTVDTGCSSQGRKGRAGDRGRSRQCSQGQRWLHPRGGHLPGHPGQRPRVADLEATGRSAVTIRRCHATLRSALSDAVERRRLPQNSAQAAETPDPSASLLSARRLVATRAQSWPASTDWCVQQPLHRGREPVGDPGGVPQVQRRFYQFDFQHQQAVLTGVE